MKTMLKNLMMLFLISRTIARSQIKAVFQQSVSTLQTRRTLMSFLWDWFYNLLASFGM